MLENLPGLSKLASTKKNRIGNLLLVPIGSPCLLGLWDGCHKKKNLKKVPWVPTASLHCCIAYIVFGDEQPNSGRSHDIVGSRHERHLDGRMQRILGDKILKQDKHNNRIHFAFGRLDFLQNHGVPILSLIQRLLQRSTCNRLVVYHWLLVQVPFVNGIRLVLDAPLLDLFLDESRSQHFN